MNILNLALASELEISDNSLVSRPRKENAVAAASPDDSLAGLIARGRRGDISAMEAIYSRYKTALFNLACRYARDRSTAEDILQDIFIKILTHLDDVNRVETFTAWVYRIALNTCYSHLRGRRTEIEKSVPLDAVEGTLHAACVEVGGADLRKPLDEAIGRLPRRLKEIFLLHDVEGFKHDEIARMLGLAVGTSKSQLFKARMRLRDILKTGHAC